MKQSVISREWTTTPTPAPTGTRSSHRRAVRQSLACRRAAIALGLLVLVSVWAAPPWLGSPTMFGGNGSSAPIYTLAAMARNLAHNPGAWRGRSVSVRGRLVLFRWYQRSYTLGQLLQHARLVDVGGGQEYPLAPSPSSGFARTLRRLPVIAALLPTPPLPRVGRVAVYRVQFHVAPPGDCPVCYEAILLDFTQP